MDQGLGNEDIEAEEVELEELLKEETEEREPSSGDIQEKTEEREPSNGDIQEKTEGKEPSRGDSDYGSIKSLGFIEKVISKTFRCMKPRARIGVYFLLTIILEVVGLTSGISTIWLLMKTGFFFEGSALLLVQEFFT